MVAAAVVRIKGSSFDKRRKVTSSYGSYTTFRDGCWVDVYAIWLAQSQTTSKLGLKEDADRTTFGTRIVGSSLEGLSYGVEPAGQQGNVAGPWASHL